MYAEERNLRGRGFKLIAGTDEAGRGPLAGPVVAAAVIFPEQYRNNAIRNSKELAVIERERLFVELYYLREHSPSEIARILNTTKNNVYQLKSIVREKMKEMVKKKYKISAT